MGERDFPDGRVGVVVLAPCGLTLGLQYFPRSHVSDDAYISFRYIQRLLEGQPGERHHRAMGNVEAFERLLRGEC